MNSFKLIILLTISQTEYLALQICLSSVLLQFCMFIIIHDVVDYFFMFCYIISNHNIKNEYYYYYYFSTVKLTVINA